MRREISFLTLIATMALSVSASAQTQLRPEIAKPLQEAEIFIAQGDYKAAKALIAKAAGVPNKTVCEQWVVNSIRNYALAKFGEPVPPPTLASIKAGHGCV